jgi:HEAT repeat protein/cyclophilin family peptidyl-prolyl cis-trans isomerase
MRRSLLAPSALLVAAFLAATSLAAQRRAKTPLAPADIDAIATLLMLEDARTFDEVELQRMTKSAHAEVRRRAVQAVGRIADKRGTPLLEVARQDKDVEVAATAAWAAGQLRDPAAIAWLSDTLAGVKTPASIGREAAIALGKIQSPDARAALAQYLSSAPIGSAPAASVGEALLSIGRFPAGGDLAPILRWTTSPDVEVRWRATWALVRPRDAAALNELLRLSRDSSGDVRLWAVRGLIPHENVDPAPAAARLRHAVQDPDRRVRTEALRALGMHDDDASVKVVLDMLDSEDSWLSVSAAEAVARHQQLADVVVPRLAKAAGTGRPVALRLTARQSLARLGAPAKAALDALSTEGLPAAQPPAVRGPRPQPQLRTHAEYRRIVERWIVPDYNGVAKPRAVWETPRGVIELELYPGDAPLGTEYFVRVTESGEIVGTEFTRVVPNFVAQQRGIRNDIVLRDEVSRRGLTRGNLSWASAGLDTGRPGYTLGVTPQPHNEGNFTALGRVVRGMDVVERLELGDAITAARMVR